MHRAVRRCQVARAALAAQFRAATLLPSRSVPIPHQEEVSNVGPVPNVDSVISTAHDSSPAAGITDAIADTTRVALAASTIGAAIATAAASVIAVEVFRGLSNCCELESHLQELFVSRHPCCTQSILLPLGNRLKIGVGLHGKTLRILSIKLACPPRRELCSWPTHLPVGEGATTFRWAPCSRSSPRSLCRHARAPHAYSAAPVRGRKAV